MKNKIYKLDTSKLTMGEPVKCPECEEGIFVPADEYKNVSLDKCYWFYCNKCGLPLHRSPAWEADILK